MRLGGGALFERRGNMKTQFWRRCLWSGKNDRFGGPVSFFKW